MIELKPPSSGERAPHSTPELERVREHRSQVYAEGSVRMVSGERREIFPGAVREWAGQWLRDTIIREGAERTIETGFGLGITALFMIEGTIEAAQLRGCPEGAGHTAVDPDQRCGFDCAGLLNIEGAGVGARLELIEEDSMLALPQLIGSGRQFDLAFVDGEQSFEASLADTVFMLRLVRPGGLVVIDDQSLAPVRSATDFVIKNLGVGVETPETPSAAQRFAVLRRPERSVPRSCQRFVPFWAGQGETPPVPAASTLSAA